jgi:hypothetical protein
VSNTPSSPEAAGTRVQPSVIFFVVMLLALGVLILAAGNMDPRSLASAQQRYTFWRSDDGHVTLDRPADWLPTKSGVTRPFTYRFATNNSLSNTPPLVFEISAASINEPGMPAGAKTPKELITLITSQPPAGVKQDPYRPVSLNGMDGYAMHASAPAAQGSPTTIDEEFWVLAIDAEHVMFITFVTDTADWSRYRPLFEHTIQTIQFDQDFVRVLDLPPAEATVEPTAQATAAQ